MQWFAARAGSAQEIKQFGLAFEVSQAATKPSQPLPSLVLSSYHGPDRACVGSFGKVVWNYMIARIFLSPWRVHLNYPKCRALCCWRWPSVEKKSTRARKKIFHFQCLSDNQRLFCFDSSLEVRKWPMGHRRIAQKGFARPSDSGRLWHSFDKARPGSRVEIFADPPWQDRPVQPEPTQLWHQLN